MRLNSENWIAKVMFRGIVQYLTQTTRYILNYLRNSKKHKVWFEEQKAQLCLWRSDSHIPRSHRRTRAAVTWVSFTSSSPVIWTEKTKQKKHTEHVTF